MAVGTGGLGPGRESSSYGGSKDYGGGSHNQAGSNRDRGRGSGSGSFQGGGPNPRTRDRMMAQDAMGARVAKALDDFHGRDDSFLDTIGNKIASFLGAEEEDPSMPGFSAPGMPGITGRANWSWDPVTAIGNVGSTVAGIPVVGSLIQGASSLAGRPAAVPLGPDFFGPSPTRPDLPYDSIKSSPIDQAIAALSDPFGAGSSSQPQYGSPATAQNPHMGGTPPAGGPGTPAISPGQAQVHPTGGPQNPGLAANPAQAQPGALPTPPAKTIAPVPTPKPLTSTPYGWGQVTLPQPNYFMSQMT